MSPVSWVKKKLGRRRTRSAKSAAPFPRTSSSLLQPSLDSLSVPLVNREIHITTADLRRANSQNKTDMFSEIDDLESIVLHLMENKVTLIRRKSFMNKGPSKRSATVFYKSLSRRASRIARFSSLGVYGCLGVNGMILPHSKYV
ncbi:hypothetical protein L484_019981 [Morus notabilis]|uniref:Uncharacterized protein n=1 Tax=Morus notabilis TaxID=981085 RepID=W9QX45_9ROSA|nr:uncharacterized protein LOC21402896 [Morus notabilis]EXB56936.1 hypothetical protein L484_019981 [Morus notabilis]